MKTGVELIMQERNEQISKHGWSAKHDATHIQCELLDAAIYAIRPNKFNSEVCGWFEFQRKVRVKSKVERLVVAGALIAAEIDRIQGDEV